MQDKEQMAWGKVLYCVTLLPIARRNDDDEDDEDDDNDDDD